MAWTRYLPAWHALVGFWMVIAPLVLGFTDHTYATISSLAAGVASLIGAGVSYWYGADQPSAADRQRQAA